MDPLPEPVTYACGGFLVQHIDGVKLKTNNKKMADSEPELEDGVKKKSKKKHEETKVDSEADDGKRKRDDCDLGAQENTDKEMKRKSKKKKKESVDSEVKESNEDSMKDAVKEKKKKKKKKKKQSEDSKAEENGLINSTKDAKRKRKKQESGESDKDVTIPPSKSTKKVKFSDQLETFLFPIEDEEEEGKLVRGKRYTKEEDGQVKKAVLEYIDKHELGDDGIDMVMKCKSHPQLKGYWKEIASSLPKRPYESVYNHALSIFEAESKRVWKKEDYELLFELYKKHGNDWRTIGDAMGKDRKHVRDA